MILFLRACLRVQCGKYFFIIYIYTNFIFFIVFRSIVPDVFKCMNMLEAIGCILYNNTYQKNIETLTETQVQIFEIIEQLREPQKMFMYLRKHFAIQFDIDLYIIAYENGKFSLINQDNYNKKKMAFLSFNEDNTVCGPLYTVNVNGTKKTVFSSNNNDIRVDVYVYVTQLNSNSKILLEYFNGKFLFLIRIINWFPSNTRTTSCPLCTRVN